LINPVSVPDPIATLQALPTGCGQQPDVPASVISQNQQTPCTLQAGFQSGAINSTITMTTEDSNTTAVSPDLSAGECQPTSSEVSTNSAITVKNESEAIAVAPHSIADSVVQTSSAGEGIRTSENEGNPSDGDTNATSAESIRSSLTNAERPISIEPQEIAAPSCPLHAAQPLGSYPNVEAVHVVLGESVVLLPIPSRKKGPVFKGWQDTTLTQTQKPEYLRRLNQGNIGVLLGAPSNGLCTVDIDSDMELEVFLTLNPILAETLTTKGARGAQLWVKVEGEYPPLTKLKTDAGEDYGEWRSGGGQSIIHGVHPSGVPYQRLKDAPPATITFDQIVWPENVKLPWVKDAADLLTEQYGPAYKIEGGLKLNEFHFAAKFKTERALLWEPLEREFYEYEATSGLWKSVSTETLKFQLGLDLKRVSDQTGVEDFIFARTDGRMSGWLNTLKGMVEERDAFKKVTSKVIHCKNGMLALDCLPPELRTFHPDYRSRNASPFAFDPEAECPEFINGLLKPALDEDDIELLQLWAGSVLLGQNPAQRLMIIMGTPGGGKSTVVEIIEKVIGEQNVAQIRAEHLGKQFEMFKFLGKTLLTGKDVDPSFLNERHASIIKALVGGDLLDAEKKNGNEQFQLRGSFNVAITCNARLTVRLRGDVGAWERRILLLQYDRPKPEKRIADYASKLIREEGSGILNWLISGALMYLAEVEEFGDIRLTPAQSERVDRLLKESDSLRQFVETRVVKAPLDDLTGEELRTGYLDFCEEMGWRSFDLREVNAGMGDLMMQIHKVRQRHDISRGGDAKRGFKGVRLLEGGAH
jgi:P4 family phage/plasmid primase-like protien